MWTGRKTEQKANRSHENAPLICNLHVDNLRTEF